MEPSILTSTKKILGLEANYTVFDLDILTHINAALSTLHQLGLGPINGTFVEDATVTWASLTLPPDQLNMARTYLYLKVRLLFDPPSTSFHLEAMKQQITECEWRLSVFRETTDWVSPTGPTVSEDFNVLDGGTVV